MIRKKKKTVKKIKEEDFDVELTKDVAGSPQTTTKSISGATSAADALTKAKQGDTEKYDKITATKRKMGAAAPVKPARTAAKTTATTTGMAGLGESKKKTVRKKKTETRKRKTGVRAFKLTENYKSNRFDYPYSIMLPAAFDGLIKAIVEKTNDVKLSERYSKLYIQVPNAKAMDTFMESLVKKAKGRDKDPKSETVINGIMGSIK